MDPAALQTPLREESEVFGHELWIAEPAGEEWAASEAADWIPSGHMRHQQHTADSL